MEIVWQITIGNIVTLISLISLSVTILWQIAQLKVRVDLMWQRFEKVFIIRGNDD